MGYNGFILNRNTGDTMPKFQIPRPSPKLPTTTTKSIRFPNELVEEVETAIQILEAVRVALLDLKQEEEDHA